MEGDPGRHRIAKMRQRYSYAAGDHDKFMRDLQRANPTGMHGVASGAVMASGALPAGFGSPRPSQSELPPPSDGGGDWTRRRTYSAEFVGFDEVRPLKKRERTPQSGTPRL